MKVRHSLLKARSAVLLLDSIDMGKPPGKRHRGVVNRRHLGREQGFHFVARLNACDDGSNIGHALVVGFWTLRADVDYLVHEAVDKGGVR